MKSVSNETFAQWLARRIICGVAAAKMTVEMYRLYFSKIRMLSKEERALLTKDDEFMAEVKEITDAYGAIHRAAHSE